MGPSGVEPQGAAWQALPSGETPQQISPVPQTAALMQAAAAASAAPLLLVVPPEDEDEEVSPESPVFVVAGVDELLQPDASARPSDPTLSVVTKRIFEFCMGKVPPPELMKSAAPYTGAVRQGRLTIVTVASAV